MKFEGRRTMYCYSIQYDAPVQILLRLLRHRGIPLSPEAVHRERWTEGRLLHLTDAGARGLGLYSITARPDSGPMAVLYAATVARVVDDSLVLRGIERIETDQGVAAVLQEWCLRPRTSLGPSGLANPDAQERRPDLPPSHGQLMQEIEEAAKDYRKPGRSGRLGPGGRR